MTQTGEPAFGARPVQICRCEDAPLPLQVVRGPGRGLLAQLAGATGQLGEHSVRVAGRQPGLLKRPRADERLLQEQLAGGAHALVVSTEDRVELDTSRPEDLPLRLV